MQNSRKLRITKDFIRESDSFPGRGEYRYSIETENGWITLTKEQSEALQKLENGFFGNPMLSDDEEEA